MSRLFVRLAVSAAVLIGLSVVVPAPVSAQEILKDDPDFLALSAGWYDWNRQKEQAAEFRAEYRSDKKLWIFKPFADVAYTTTNQGFVGAGVLIDIYFGNRWVLTPSFAPQYYWGGDKKLDLGYWLEFRSQLELAYRFDNRSRIGLAVSHYSNASLGDTNPGTEQATLYYEIPLNNLFSLGK